MNLCLQRPFDMLLAACCCSVAWAEQGGTGHAFAREGDGLDAMRSPFVAPYEWPNAPPPDLPHPRSADILGIRFTGRYANYTGADTWYFAWAADGYQYSPWTDGYVWTPRSVAPLDCNLCKRGWSHLERSREWSAKNLSIYHCHSNLAPTSIGLAKISGDSPLNLRFDLLGRLYSGQDQYPCVSAMAGKHYFVGTYNAFQKGGPFAGFFHSRDWDHWVEELKPNWSNPHWTDARPKSLEFFPPDGEPRRFQATHTVFYGQDNQLAPDGKLYFTSHGATPGGYCDWDKGDAIYLCRVDATATSITNPQAYEFFAGNDPPNEPTWSVDVQRAAPILAWPGKLGSESITYIPGLRKHLLCTSRLAEREAANTPNTTMIWEADALTGPYRLVTYWRDWGPQTYFPNIPAKFISPDGRRMWLCTAANYSVNASTPPQCRYAASLHEIVLDIRDTASTPMPRWGVEVGVHAQRTMEPDGSLTLRWNTPQQVAALWLFDPPGAERWIRTAKLSFSDGSVEQLAAWLPNSGDVPGEVSFATKQVTSITIEVEDADGDVKQCADVLVFAPHQPTGPLEPPERLLVRDLGASPPVKGVVLSQTEFDRGGNTSLRQVPTAELLWKEAGYFRRNRDLGQVFVAPRDFRLGGIVVRLGPHCPPLSPLAREQGDLFLQLFRVAGEVQLADNETPAGERARHGFTANHRADDYLWGVEYHPLFHVRGGRAPLLSDDSTPLRYLEFQLTESRRPTLIAGERYAFLIGFCDAASGAALTLANRNRADEPRPGDLPAIVADGWAIRREGNGQAPKIFGVGNPRSLTTEQLASARRSALLPSGVQRFRRAPQTEGYPDVDSYRDLEFYLLEADVVPSDALNRDANLER
jgi:hypothetical protein